MVSPGQTSPEHRILEATRRLIAERGYEGVTIRELARAAQVSVPTLYSRFGGRDELLFAAIESHAVDLVDRVPQDPETKPLEALLGIVDVLADELLARTDFARVLFSLFARPSSTADALMVATGTILARALRRPLKVMKRKRQLRSWIEPHVIAQRITSECFSTGLSWARGHIPDDTLRSSLVYAVSMTLLAAVEPGAGGAIQRLARETQGAADWSARAGRTLEGA